MTAEEYVVKELQETKEELQLQEGYINSLRSTVSELYEKLNCVLRMINLEEGGENSTERYCLSVWNGYGDEERFSRLKEIMEGDVF